MINVNQVFERVSEGLSSATSLKILEVTQDERAWAHSLAEVIGGDRAFSVRFLFLAGLVNGLPRRVTTVSQAVTTLGFGTVKALTLWLTLHTSAAADDPGDGPEPTIHLRDLWEHSLACGLIAGRMVAAEDYSPLPTAFVAGLLHDAGRVLCYRHFREEFNAALKLAASKNIPLAEAEAKIFGADHSAIGEYWARSADLPPLIQHTIRYHHSSLSSLPSSIDPLLKKTLAVVRIADHFGAESGFAALEDRSPLEEEWSALAQREEDCRRLVKRIQQEVVGVREMFGFAESAAIRSGQGGRARGQVIQFPTPNRTKNSTFGTVQGKKLTILVVEDHGSLCEVLGLYFMRSGYHVRTAGDGESALEILSKEEIHLLVLDLRLPRLDGFGLLQKLQGRREDQWPYIIVISAQGADMDRRQVLELGADEYLPKPFHLASLLEKIQAVERQLT
ncbi:MAG TPA: HDOD domain-containing protein [Candidatus Binatia bacterium]